MTTDGRSPRPSESSPAADLFGTTTTGRRRRPAWRIELQGLDQAATDSPSRQVRITLVNAETGQRVAADRLPFEWIRDVAKGGFASVTMHEGDYR